MAETVDRVTWISLAPAQEIVIAVLLSRAYAGPQIIKWLWQKRVRWTFINVFGVPRQGWSLDQEAHALWDHFPHRVLVDYEQSFARKPMIFPSGGKGDITVIGIRVAKEDIEAALAADYPNFVSAPLPVSDESTVDIPAPADLDELEDTDWDEAGRAPAAKSQPRPRNRRWQRAIAILQNLYPDRIPSEDEATKADLCHAVERNWDSDLVPNPEKLPVPSLDTLERIVDDLRSTS